MESSSTIAQVLTPRFIGELITEDSVSRLQAPLRLIATDHNRERAVPPEAVIVKPVGHAMSAPTTQQLLMLRHAVESGQVGMMIADAKQPNYPIQYVNPAFERITGYPASEAIGKGLLFLHDKDWDRGSLDRVAGYLADLHDGTEVLKSYRKNGTLFWSKLSVSPVSESGGSISHFAVTMADITEQKDLETERRFLADHDSVTGLPKYAGSEARIEELISRTNSAEACEKNLRMALFFLDLDNFNTINDTMGFAMGDETLRLIGERLRQAAGPDAEVVRYASDEFLIAMGGIQPEADLTKLAFSFCEIVGEPLIVSPNTTLYLSASVGASAFPDTGSSALELTRQAEIANNRAKRGGRNSAFVFGHDLQEALGDRMALGSRMRDALLDGEFVLHYQPQVNAQDGALSSVEALIRWNSPEFGLLPPRRFIPIAEDCGMIQQLGAWVLRTACEQLRKWMDSGLSGFTVSINVSALQLQRPDFVEDVRRAIVETGVDASMLELELTESVLMGNADQAVKKMVELKKLGIHLALDDFGIGYSSLSYLRRFPIDKLKIDQSFIMNIAHEGNDAALVRAMISMGHHLGLSVVAEGIETAAQLGYLRRNHCDAFQGHLFAPAMAADQVSDLIRRRLLMPSIQPEEAEARTLLILDDEDNIRRSLMRLLRRDGYHILDAASAPEAFELLATHQVQVIISDQRMPCISGTQFLSQVKEMYPDTIRMVLSGFTDLASVTDAINQGAIYKFLTKPWDDEGLRAQVLDAFRRHEAPVC